MSSTVLNLEWRAPKCLLSSELLLNLGITILQRNSPKYGSFTSFRRNFTNVIGLPFKIISLRVSLWFYCTNFYRWNIQNWKYMTIDFIMIHPKLKIHECRWGCVFSTHIESTLSSHINISFVSCVHFQNHSALLTLFACQKMLLCDRKISLKTFELIEGRKTIYATTFDNKIVHCSFSTMKN